MNFSEIALTLIVALIAFGPKQLQRLSFHLGKVFHFLQTLREATHHNLQKIQQELIYQENLAKAQAVETKLSSSDSKNVIHEHSE